MSNKIVEEEELDEDEEQSNYRMRFKVNEKRKKVRS